MLLWKTRKSKAREKTRTRTPLQRAQRKMRKRPQLKRRRKASQPRSMMAREKRRWLRLRTFGCQRPEKRTREKAMERNEPSRSSGSIAANANKKEETPTQDPGTAAKLAEDAPAEHGAGENKPEPKDEAKRKEETEQCKQRRVEDTQETPAAKKAKGKAEEPKSSAAAKAEAKAKAKADTKKGKRTQEAEPAAAHKRSKR
jgi:hypothetical protein